MSDSVRYRMFWFQSTRPHGARPHPPETPRHARHRFNPRARTGRDAGVAGVTCPVRRIVSIHAPARGATHRPRHGHSAHRRVSIHAPARGATRSRHEARRLPASFNPRARTGRDLSFSLPGSLSPCFNPRARTGRDTDAGVARPRLAVSIHAPARGATHLPVTRPSGHGQFQSTRPHGARLSRALPRCNRPHSFNPRARTGRDADPNHAGTGGMVSIHAPARGATTERTTPMNDIDVFQSTRPHGARRTTVPRPGRRSMFQSTRPHGARRSVRQARSAHWSVSIHAPARGATSLPRSILAQRLVSIHAPARGATVTNWTRASSMPLFQSTRPHGARRQMAA